MAGEVADGGCTGGWVAALIPLSESDRRRVIREIKRKHSFVPVAIRENLSWDDMAHIEVNAPELAGVSIEQGLTRDYPLGDMASHVIGYVSAVAGKGLTGGPPLGAPGFRLGKSGAQKADPTGP